MRLKIGRTGGPRFREAYRKAWRRKLDELGKDDLDAEEHIVVFREAVARTALHGWEGIEDTDGKTPLAFSVEKAVEILTDPRFSHMAEFVSMRSDDLDRYRVGDEGN